MVCKTFATFGHHFLDRIPITMLSGCACQIQKFPCLQFGLSSRHQWVLKQCVPRLDGNGLLYQYRIRNGNWCAIRSAGRNAGLKYLVSGLQCYAGRNLKLDQYPCFGTERNVR